MKKLIVVVLVLLLVNLVAYGQSWQSGTGKIYVYPTLTQVGMGVSSPSARLDIADLGNDDDVSILSFSENNTIDEFVFKGDFAGTGETGNLLKLETYWGNNAMTWRGDGNVGIGVTNPGKKLEVAGDIKIPVNKRIYFGGAFIEGYYSGFDGLKFYGNGGGDENLGITVSPGGNVGIGTDNPGDFKLAVNGTVSMSGFKLTTGADSGYVLTSNSSGVGTWQPAGGGSGSCLWDKLPDNSIYYNDGSVGIGTGTSSPSARLDIASLGASNDVPILVMSENTNDEFVFKGDFAGTGETGNALKLETMWGNNAMTWRGDGKVGIGTTEPHNKLEIGNAFSFHDGGDKIIGFGYAPWYGGDLNPEEYAAELRLDPQGGILSLGVATEVNGTPSTVLAVTSDGNVGIGTTNPGSYKLAVNGHIRTKEITVESDWSDFVFADSYDLMSLDKLEEHIKVNRSLPGIPTEKEVEENGVKVGEMQAKLLEKVEELTLYVIELKKENETLKKRIGALEN